MAISALNRRHFPGDVGLRYIERVVFSAEWGLIITRNSIPTHSWMKWAGGIRFEGKGEFGHTIVTDGDKKAGGEEAVYKPIELLLFGVAGCTGVDVAIVLKKTAAETLLSGD